MSLESYLRNPKLKRALAGYPSEPKSTAKPASAATVPAMPDPAPAKFAKPVKAGK